MKRFFAVICLVIALMVTLPANAEWELPLVNDVFSIRNGISFGMTKKEVNAVEKSNGNIPDFNEASYVGFKDIAFLGKDAWLFHHFTKDDKLSSFAYSRMGYSHTFAELREVLVKKYGEPMLTTELSLFSTAIWAEVPFNLFPLIEEWSADTLFGGATASTHDRSIWISNYAVWLVKYADCAVLVELAEANNGKYLSLGYASLSHEDMEAWLRYREEENNDTQSSYANDI